MKKKTYAKEICLWSAILLLTCVTAVMGLWTPTLLKSVVWAEETAIDCAIDDLTKWTAFAYDNLPDWAETEIHGEQTWGYELSTTKEEAYSADSSLTSPLLTLSKNEYTLTFGYYTRMRSATPNELTFSFSEDGEEYISVQTFYCTDTNDEFTYETVTFEGKPRYLRFDVHSYYAKDSESDTAKRGIYFLPELIFTVPDSDRIFSTDFEYVGLENDVNSFVYNGNEQKPVPVFHSEKYKEGTDFYCVCKTLRESDKQPTESVHVGNYILHIDIYDKANRTNYAVDFSYSVTLATIVLKKEDFTFYCNGKYAVILGVDLKDESGRKINADEITALEYGVREGTVETFSDSNVLSCKKGCRLGVRITSSDFNAYSAFPCDVTEEDCVSATYYFTTDASFDRSFRYSYDGKKKEPFGKDFFLAPEQPTSAPEYDLRYYQGQEEVKEIRNAGEYRMVLTLLEKEFTFFVEVTPKTLTSCRYVGEKLEKDYDGTTDIYDSKTGRQKDFSADIVFKADEIIEGDEIYFSDSSLQYARSTGKTYLVADKTATLVGKDGNNYILSSSFSVESDSNKAEILPVQAVLVGDTDGDGQKITVADKVYTQGDLSCDYLSSSESYLNRYLPIYGNHTLIRYKDVSFTFYEGNVGVQQLRATLINASLFDRYQEEIYTPVALHGTVLPAELSVDTTDLSFLDADSLIKTYDGTTEAFPLFTGLKVLSEPTGFPTYGTDYTVKAKSASYLSGEQGTREITVTPEIICLTADAERFFADYTLSSFTVEGTIRPKTFEVYSRAIRIFVGESPASHILANAPATEYTYRIYDKFTHEALNYWDSVAGEYELRIRSSSSNYEMPDESGDYAPIRDENYIVDLTVVQKEKARQQILFSDLNLEGGTSFVMLAGSVYTFTAYSVNEEKVPTDLSIQYTLSDPDRITTFDEAKGILTAKEGMYGEVTMTVSQKGDRYYYAADDIVLTVRVQNEIALVQITEPDHLYAYSELPFLSAESFQVGDTAYGGTLTSGEGTLLQGENSYTYYILPLNKINPVKKNFSISGDFYEINGSTYVLADENYSVYNEYFAHVYRAVSLTENGTITDNSYYEREYVQTADTFFQTGKTYYTAGYALDGTVQTGTTVPKDIYYEKIKGAYTRSPDTTFKANPSMYYILTFTEAPTPWEANEIYYERDDVPIYYRTLDQKAQSNKTYYVVDTITEAIYNVGDPIQEGRIYYYLGEDTYELTTDKLFIASKEYYTVRYTPASVAEETAIDGVYYEVGENYILSRDNVVLASKTYYIKEYIQKYFVSAGGDTSSLYFERDEGGNYTATGDSVFSKDKTYYISVWTPYTYEGEEEPLPADGSWCEKLPDEYVKTTDEIFIEGKSYYVLSSLGNYVLAVVTAGEAVKDMDYFEKRAYTNETYPTSTDLVKQSGKTYYILSYERVEFLEGGKMPDGIFYQKVPTYRKTEDTVFDEEKVYYTIAYGREECEKGDSVLGEYYCYNESSKQYERETGRYFSYSKTYYSPVFTPYNEKQETNIAKQRTANTLYTYYIEKPSSEEYQVGTTYYEWVDNTFVKVDGTPVEDGTRRYLLFTGSRFEDGVTYYYYFQPFLGNIPVQITLTAEKPTLTVYVKENYSARSTAFSDFNALVEKIELQGEIIPLEEGLEKMGQLSFILPFELEVGANKWNSGDWIVTFFTDDYNVELADANGTYTVEKEKLVIGLDGESVLQKFYGKEIGTEEAIKNAVTVETEGDLSEEEEEAIKNALFISVQAHALSDSGEYPFIIKQKKEEEALFDDLSKRFDITFQREFLTVLPIEITVQYAGSHAYGEEDIQIDKKSNFTFTYQTSFDKEEKERLEEEIFSALRIESKQEIASRTDAGEYSVMLYVDSDNRNMSVTVPEGTYTVREAIFPETAFVLKDETVIFDKQYHALSVRYDEEKWKGVSVTYNMTNCREIGSYAITATVSMKNYKTKVLEATLYIETRNIESSNKSKNAVSMTILDEDNQSGVSDKFNVVLKELNQTTDEESMNAVTILLNETRGENTYNIVKTFALQVYDGKDKTDLSFTSYDISIMPSDLTYNENNILYGFTDGTFTAIEYTYKNGVYTFQVSGKEGIDPLQYFVFVQDSDLVVTEYPKYTYWIVAGAIGLVLLSVFASIFAGLSASRGKAKRQRRRLIKHI